MINDNHDTVSISRSAWGLSTGAERDEWQSRALCAQVDPERWFPEKGGSTREAKRICNGTADREGCPVRAECLQYALDHDERFGIWGGFSERERRALRHGQDCICAGCRQVWERIARESRGVA